jgi:hypothetical protein
MSDATSSINPEGTALDIAQIPKSALQAIYHAVTGKTENYSKTFRGNVLIRAVDIDRLYDTFCQQIEHYELLAKQTVTVVVKSSKNRTTTYSSWERFKALKVNVADVTSEVSIKLEFVAILPNTNVPQRCVINVSLDSALPVIESNNEEESEESFSTSDFFIYLSQRWPSVNISIDFVDFLIARSIISHTEEWFANLEKIHVSAINSFLLKNGMLINTIMRSGALIGFALFIGAYAKFASEVDLTIVALLKATSVVVSIFAMIEIIMQFSRRKIFKRISKNLSPTVILLTDADTTTYSKILASRTSANYTMMGIVGTIIGGIAINIISSYLFIYLNSSS